MSADSPLLFPVYIKDNKIYVLDETLLPFAEHYIEVNDIEDALAILKNMKTRSLGQVLLFFYSCLFFKANYPIETIVSLFNNIRPTFDFSLLGWILVNELKRYGNLGTAIDNFISRFDKSRRERAKTLADILPDPAKILTICNFNGELIYLYEELTRRNKEGYFVVCETRPYLQGTRLTFWELTKNNIPCRLICDNQVPLLMKKGEINCLITGADRATKKGDVINKIGTYALARLAGYYNIPFYPLIQYPKDIDIDGIEIEERSGEEVFMFLPDECSIDEGCRDVEAIYPSFDITRAEFVTKCIELSLQGEK